MRRAVMIDALGTIVWLEPPWERIDPAVVAGIPADRVRAAFSAEMAYYREHSDRGRDRASLAALRERCAAVLSEGIGREVGVEAMLDAIRFRPFADAVPALDRLRGLGLGLVCVSNWDCSLPEVLARLGLAVRFDAILTSAVVGARKPDPAIFAAALEAAGCEAGEAIHVGDSEEDIIGARAAGIEALRIDRSGAGQITSLAEIERHL